ncbi:unnamed protein product [Brassica napus]|uniref:(rape) hypothetical protein n=1 Tax=Brassica napus TaxID=3708 RepID=A0A816U3W0_BRANA|nr:unnamed protein product [Brassica napus]
MFRCGVFREVEACSDPPPPALASGMGLLQIRLRRLLVTRAGAKSSCCRRNPVFV